MVLQHEEEESQEEAQSEGMDWDDWLKTGDFYIFGFVYMFAKIALHMP